MFYQLNSLTEVSWSLSLVGLGPLFEVLLICLVQFGGLILVPSWSDTVMLDYR